MDARAFLYNDSGSDLTAHGSVEERLTEGGFDNVPDEMSYRIQKVSDKSDDFSNAAGDSRPILMEWISLLVCSHWTISVRWLMR